MCYLQTILYKCGCISYRRLCPCELYPDMRDDATDCPRFGNDCKEIKLPYCCPKVFCWSTCCIRDLREQREESRLEEESRQERRELRKASFEEWEKTWGREEGKERRVAEQKSQEAREIEQRDFERLEEMWMQDEMRREGKTQPIKVKKKLIVRLPLLLETKQDGPN